MISAAFVFMPFLAQAQDKTDNNAGSGLIRNGDFSVKGVKPWKIFATKGVTKPTFKVADGVVTIVSAQSTEKAASEQMSQLVGGIESATKYKLVFDAKSADASNDMIVSLARSKEWSKGHYGMFKKMKLTSDWKTHTVYFTSKQIDEGNAAQVKFLFGLLKGEISFRNVKLIEGKK